MAYVRSVNTSYGSLVTTLSCAIPEHQTNDLILALYSKNDSNGGAWTTPSSPVYQTTNNQNIQSNALSSAFFWRIATSSSEGDVVSTTTDSDHYTCQVIVIADVDTVDPINSSRNDSFSSSAQHVSTTLATDEDKCLIIYHELNDGARYPNVQPGLMLLSAPYSKNIFQSSAAWTWLASSGNAPTVTYELTQADEGHINTIAINSANSSPISPPFCDLTNPPTEIIHPMRSSSTGGTFGGGSVDPIADLGSGIGPNTIDFNYQAFGTQDGGANDGNGQALKTDTPSSSSAAEYWGAVWNLSNGAIDLSNGDLVCIHVGLEQGSFFGAVDTSINSGFTVGLRSSNAGNQYAMWNGSAIDSEPSYLSQHVIVFDPTDTSLMWHEEGTFDDSDVDGIFLSGKKSAAGIDMRIHYTECHRLKDVSVVGGDATKPCNFDTIEASVKASNVLTMGGDYMQGFQVGNGSEAVHWKPGNSARMFHLPASGKKLAFNVAGTVNGATFYGVSGDTIDNSNVTLNGPAGWPYIIHASSTSAATWLSALHVVIAADVILQDVFTAQSGITFTGCKEIIHNNADISGGCTIDNCTDTNSWTITGTSQAIIQAGLDDLANCTFTNNTTAIRINYTGLAANFSVVGPTSLTYDGNTVDLHYNSTNLSTLTFTPGSGADAPSAADSGNGTLVVDSSVAITLIGQFDDASALTSGLRYRIFNDTQATELYNDVVGGSGLSISTTIGAGLAIEVGDLLTFTGTYQNSTTYFEEMQATITGNATSNVFSVVKTNWVVPESFGLDGSTIDTVKFNDQTGTDRIDVLDDWTFAQFVSWWGYIITTEEGIRNWFKAITLIDNANARINNATADILLDNAGTEEYFQTASGRVFRTDEARPVAHPTSGGGGLDPQWLIQVLAIETGSGMTGPQEAKIDAILSDTGDMQPKLGTPAGASMSEDIAEVNTVVDTIDTNVASLPTLNEIFTTQMTESYAGADVEPTLAQALYYLGQQLGDFSISGTTITVNKLGGGGAAGTHTLDDGTNPTSSNRVT